MTNELATALNNYLANVGVSYIKLHNLHWNVIGKDFKPVHEFLEVLYDGMNGVLDEVAEILKMNEQMPLGSMKDYLQVATIKELENKAIKTDEAMKIVLDDMILLQAQAEAVRSQADAADQYEVVALMEGNLAQYKKTIWFLKSSL